MNNFRTISSAFGIALTGWPLIILFTNGIKGSYEFSLLTNSLTLMAHVPFWVGFEFFARKYLDAPSTNGEAKLSVLTVLFGLPLFIGTYCVNAQLLTFQAEKSFTLPFSNQALYLLTLSAVLELALGFLVVVCFISIFESIEHTHRIRKLASYALWSVASLFLCFCAIKSLSAQYSQPGNCEEMTKYWLVMFIQLGIVQLSLLWVPAVLFSHNSYLNEDTPPALKRLGALYMLAYFPFNLYWCHAGLGHFYDIFLMCGKDDIKLMFSFIYYGWSIVPGCIVCLCLVLGITGYLIFIVLKKLFPEHFVNVHYEPMEAENDGSSLGLDQPLNIKLEAQEFDADNNSYKYSKEEVCSICLEEFQQKQQIAHWKPCQHLFHYECIQNWAQRRRNCPICKRNYQL